MQDLADNVTAPWTRIQSVNPFNAGRRLQQRAATPSADDAAAGPSPAQIASAPYNVDLTTQGKQLLINCLFCCSDSHAHGPATASLATALGLWMQASTAAAHCSCTM